MSKFKLWVRLKFKSNLVSVQLDMCGGLGYILPIIVLSIIYNIVKLFEVETVYHEVGPICEYYYT